jgi:hypothetical protein
MKFKSRTLCNGFEPQEIRILSSVIVRFSARWKSKQERSQKEFHEIKVVKLNLPSSEFDQEVKQISNFESNVMYL